MVEKKDIGFIVGGAVIGAAVGYIIRKIGINRILEILKENNIIPEKVVNAMEDFGQNIEPD
ncbi:MAG: hypothetical protein R6U35_05220 [Candidatus Humimicrobiaceae bacterium]